MTASINGTTGVTFPDSSTQNTAATGFGFKNRIINGHPVIDQRNSGASVTIPASANTYTIDRWYGYGEQASKFSVQQSSTAADGFVKSALITSLSAYSVLSSDTFQFAQKIEGFNTADFGWGTANAKPITLSFWVRSSLTGTFGGSVTNSALSRSYPFSYTISAANTWEQKSVTIAGDTTGTWATDNGTGLRLHFGLGAGSTYSGTAGTWASAWYSTCTGATSVVGTNGATFYITGVQLEKGSTATSFDYRPYGTELALCQRYYEKTSFPYRGSAFNAGGQGFCMWLFKTTKRAAPTITYVNSVYTSVDFVQVDGVLIATNDTNYPTIGTGSSATAEL